MNDNLKGLEHLPSLRHLMDASLASRGLVAEFARAAAQDIEELLELFPVRREAVLTASGWTGSGPYTQTVAVEGVRADETAQLVQPVPAARSMDAWEAAGVKCTEQGAGALTFKAEEKPAGDMQIFVILQEVAG